MTSAPNGPDLLNLQCISDTSTPLLKCCLCNGQEFGRALGTSHIKSEKHTKKFRCYREALELLNLPNPSPDHVQRLTGFLITEAQREALSEDHILARLAAVERLNTFVRKVAPNCSVRLYGSLVNGFATYDSDINVDLVINHCEETEETAAEQLSKIAEAISNSNEYKNIVKEFNIKVPKINFTEQINGKKCSFELILSAERSFQTSELLRTYCSFDPRIKNLAICLKKWARSCSFDDQDNGTWPSHAFPIMLIHYAQRCSPPILPYVQEVPDKEKQKKEELQSVGAIDEDDILPSEEAKEIDAADISIKDMVELRIKELKETWKTENTRSVGEIWLGFWRYFALEFRAGKEVLSIRKTPKEVMHKDKGWSTRVLAIEEPCKPMQNLSRSVGSMQIFEVFMTMVRRTYEYFYTPYVKGQPLFKRQNFLFKQLEESDVQNELIESMANCRIRTVSTSSVGDEESNDSDSEDDDEYESGDRLCNKRDQSSSYRLAATIAQRFGHTKQLPSDIKELLQTLDAANLEFSLDMRNFPFFRRPPEFCKLCHKTGHKQSKCPIENLPDPVPLVELPEELLQQLDDLCVEIYHNTQITEPRKHQHERVRAQLEEFIRKRGHDQSVLELFGSTKNGFGSNDCDLDLCLTFSDNATGAGLNQAQIINNLALILKQHPHIDDSSVLAIVAAKVPIVKFHFRDGDHLFQCDISLYNVLAKSNTRLLQSYCAIDERLQILGVFVKRWARTCQIGDASRGSLSSYAYTLMTLHFLQRTDPPILPSLQELRPLDGSGLGEILVDGWNTWFFDDLDHLDQVWPYLGQNVQSVAELFMDFLKYYSDVFNFEEHVICTRQLKPLTRLEKMWTGKKIAIEDPFLHSHNLGQGVDNQMATFIKTCFRLSRNHFCSPVQYALEPAAMISYYFDTSKLTRGPLPTGRGCRICGRIGHKIRECDQKRRGRRPMPIANGRVRTCNACGSPDHLIRDCPNRNGTQRAQYYNGRPVVRGPIPTGMEYVQRNMPHGLMMENRARGYPIQAQGSYQTNSFPAQSPSQSYDMFPPLGGNSPRNQAHGSPRRGRNVHYVNSNNRH